MQLLRAARELGVDVPGELAVAGFDDVKEAAMTDPPLTTVASDRQAMARTAVGIALDPQPDAATSGGAGIDGVDDMRTRARSADLLAFMI